LTKNELYCGDNLEIMRTLLRDRGAFIDLIYIDPPSNSNRDYSILFKDREQGENAQVAAFADAWSNGSPQKTIEEIQDLGLPKLSEYLNFVKKATSVADALYLSMMAIRIYYMRELLKDTGGFYLHCEPKMGYHLRMVCDLIFGAENFVNEIIWHYQTISMSKRHFGRSHDVILFYGKTDKYKFDFMSVKTARADKVLKRAANSKGARFSADDIGRIATDVFEIAAFNRVERLRYPTQKPLALLKRIITASSAEGDIVADFFCGCGTTIDAAIELKRSYIGVDISTHGIALIQKRIKDAHNHTEKSHYDLHGTPAKSGSGL